ncbi:MAG: peptide transporter ATP-binding protein, partial [Armatimonadetes bacterium]|nr:peptide transporter ATP-binding protein [Armatimonadota bacterium]
QRVMIAIALSCNPEILIADEPTTALDVTIQAKILDLLKELRTQRQMALMLITHNMGLVAEMCDRVLVMHGGRIVEAAGVEELFRNPAHPYTRGLLRSIPTLDSPPKQRLPTLSWDPTPEQAQHSGLVEIAPNHLVSEWAAV